MHSAFNKFPDIFVQAFKIVDSWEFSMLFLYILWDDWPIFMSSGSNEQLQQELEYTLLSQLVNFKNAVWTLEEWYAIKFCFETLKKCHAMKAGSTAMTQRPRDIFQ